MSILEVHDVSIRYMTGDFKDIGLKEYVVRKLKGNYHVNEFWADRHITFTLEKGDMLGIIGTNGAGKSTLLKAVSGIMEPTGGYVKREGNIAALLELASGFDGDLTVRENAYLRGAMLGYTRKFMDEKYDEIIAFAELQDFQDRPFKQLSSGMKSRLAFSIASLVAPDILILDEVLSVGDGAFRKKSENKMREIIAGGATTILVSHSIQQVRELCNKVLWIEKGEQLAFGDRETICDVYQQYLDHKITLEQVKEKFVSFGKGKNEETCPLGETGVQGDKPSESEGDPKDDALPVPGKAEKKNMCVNRAGDTALCIERFKASRGKWLLIYTGLFFLAFLLAYSPFFQAGKTFIWNNDGRSQHYPTLIYVGRYLRKIVLNLFHGEFSIPLFDLNLAMGGDIIATLNYYGFGNPLYLLSVFVPSHYTEYLYNALIVVRFYLAGMSFLALCAHHKKEYSHALIGALVYVFSGYAIFSACHHPYFVEPMIQLPLLLIGIDLIIQKKKPFVFIGAVLYSALCGFYFLWMMTIMLGIYTLICFFGRCKGSWIKEFFRTGGRIVGAYLLGIGLSAPFFLPSVVGFLTSGRAGETVERNYFFYGWNYYDHNFLNLIAPPGSWDALSLAALVLPALLVLLFFSKGHRKRLKRLLTVCTVFYIFPLGGYIMNGFGYPSQRWTFALALLLSYIVVETLPELLEMNRKGQMICFGAFLLYAVAVFCVGQNRTAYHVVGVALLACTLLVLYLFCPTTAAGKRMGAAACVALVLFNVVINGIYRFSPNHANYCKDFTTYGSETKRIETAIEREGESYLPFQDGRFDGSQFSRNVGTVWRIPVSNAYWSIINRSTTDLWKKTENIGINNSPHNIYGSDQRTIFDTLISVKYCIEKEGREDYVPYGYSQIKKTQNGATVYKNQYALPWGYTYDSYLPLDMAEDMNGLEREEAMLQSIFLQEAFPDIAQGTVKSDIQNVPYEIEGEDVDWTDNTLTVKKDKATMTLSFQMPANVETYIRLEGLDINNSGQEGFNITAKCETVSKSMYVSSPQSNWYWGRKDYLANLGYSEKERTSCTITFPKKGKYKLANIQLLALPMDQYPQRVEALREEPLKNVKFETNRITGTVDLSENKILCMSIPYSGGWTAKVDGEKVKILKGNYMFMAVPLTAGHHDIEFTYCTPGLKMGIVASLLSAGVVIFFARQEKKRRT